MKLGAKTPLTVGAAFSRYPATQQVGKPTRESQGSCSAGGEPLARFDREVGRVAVVGAAVGATVGGALASAVRGTSWPIVVALALSGALVGACVAEEQLRFKLGLPVEIPPAYR